MSDLDKALGDLQTALVTQLLVRIADGSATAADLNVARQLLKDNNISAADKPGSPISDLSHQLPFTDADEHGIPN